MQRKLTPPPHSLVSIIGGVLDLLGERELVAAHTGADAVHAFHCGEVVAPLRHKVNRGSDLEVLVQVLEIVQHVRILP